MNTSTYSITAVTLYTNIGGDSDAYEATISINDDFVIQVSGNKEEALFSGIAHSDEKYHATKEKQDAAFNDLESSDVEKAIEEWGFENNLEWLKDNATTTI